MYITKQYFGWQGAIEEMQETIGSTIVLQLTMLAQTCAVIVQAYTNAVENHNQHTLVLQ